MLLPFSGPCTDNAQCLVGYPFSTVSISLAPLLLFHPLYLIHSHFSVLISNTSFPKDISMTLPLQLGQIFLSFHWKYLLRV